MKILITGGFGFLGGRLAQFLSSDSTHEILLGSRIKRAAPSWLPQAKVVEINWNNLNQLLEITSGIDVVVHAAGMNAQDCAKNPALALEFNGGATQNLLEASVQNKVNRFIYLSTAHVYASPLVGVITEKTATENTHSYATSHLAGEEAVRLKHRSGEIEGIVVRLSNAFGAPAHVGANCWMLLVNDLCKQAMLTGKMILNSTGVQRRDFIALSEACRAIAYLIDLPSSKLSDGLFNIGGEWSPTIREMAELIANRFKEVAGIYPQLSLKENITGEQTSFLEYKITKLTETGFQSNGNRNVLKEIDQLILFCQKNVKELQ